MPVIRCSGDVLPEEILLRLRRASGTLVVYDRLITTNAQMTDGPESVYDWMLTHQGDPRIKVMVFQQNHLYMVLWRDQELSIKLLFKSPRTEVVQDRMARTVHHRFGFRQGRSLTRWMTHSPSCPCGSLLLNTLDALDGPLAHESAAGLVSLWEVSQSLERGFVASPRL